MTAGVGGDAGASVVVNKPRAREMWVDTAKGIAIILVVLYHAAIFSKVVGVEGIWTPLSALLASFRMPLFFFTAGLFAAGAISKDLPELFRSRVARLLWLYLIWSVIFLVVFQFAPLISDERPTVLDLALLLVAPTDSVWFLYALALFFLVAWLLRSLPVWAQFLLPGGLALVFGMNLVTTGNGPVDRMCTYFVFFLLAVHLGPQVRRFAPRVRWWHAAVVFAVFLMTTAAIYPTPLIDLPGTRFVANSCAVAAGVGLAIVLARLPGFDWLRRLGGRTLPVYLVHFYPILLICAALAPFADRLRSFGAVLPLILTVLAILFSLGAERLTRGVPGLWTLPALLVRLLAPRSDRSGR